MLKLTPLYADPFRVLALVELADLMTWHYGNHFPVEAKVQCAWLS
jgi:hypothetical protein